MKKSEEQYRLVGAQKNEQNLTNTKLNKYKCHEFQKN